MLSVGDVHSVGEKLEALALLFHTEVYRIKFTVPYDLGRTVFEFAVFPVFHSDQAGSQQGEAVFITLDGVLRSANWFYIPQIILKHICILSNS